jgi:hypothetical protein
MIPHGLHAGHVFRSHYRRLAFALIGDGAPELDNSVLDNDVDEGGRCPRLAAKLSQQPLANGLIAGRSRIDVTRSADERVQEIGPADDSNDLLAAKNGQPLDPMPLHHSHDLFERRLFDDG